MIGAASDVLTPDEEALLAEVVAGLPKPAPKSRMPYPGAPTIKKLLGGGVSAADYDMESARKAGVSRDAFGHLPSTFKPGAYEEGHNDRLIMPLKGGGFADTKTGDWMREPPPQYREDAYRLLGRALLGDRQGWADTGYREPREIPSQLNQMLDIPPGEIAPPYQVASREFPSAPPAIDFPRPGQPGDILPPPVSGSLEVEPVDEARAVPLRGFAASREEVDQAAAELGEFTATQLKRQIITNRTAAKLKRDTKPIVPPGALPAPVAGPLPAPPSPVAAVRMPAVVSQAPIPKIPAILKSADIREPHPVVMVQPPQSAAVREPHPEIQIPGAGEELPDQSGPAVSAEVMPASPRRPAPETDLALGAARAMAPERLVGYSSLPAAKRLADRMLAGETAEQAFLKEPFAVMPLGGPAGSLGAGFTIPRIFGREAAKVAKEGVGKYVSIGEHEGLPEKWAQFKKTFREQRIDDLDPLRKADAALGAEGLVYDTARLTRAIPGKLEIWFNDGPFLYGDPATDVAGVPSLRQIFKDVAGAAGRKGAWQERNIPEFRRFSIAASAKELERRGIETGIPPAEVDADYNLFRGKFEQQFKDLVAFQNAKLRYQLDAGMLDPNVYHWIIESRLSYIPWKRISDVIDESAHLPGRNRFVNIQNGIKKIAGSELHIKDPFESIVNDTAYAISGADKNAVGQRLVEAAEAAGPAGEEIIKKAKPFSKDAFTVMIGGQKHWYMTPDPELGALLQNLEGKAAKQDLIQTAMAIPASTLRAGAIWYPNFMSANPFRDAIQAWVQTKYGFVPGINTVKGAMHVLGRGDLYKLWKRSGGDQAFLTTLDREGTQDYLADLMRSPAKRAAMNIVNPLKGLAALSEFSEKMTRLGEFELAVGKEGVGKRGLQKSAMASRDVTMDYRRIGSMMRNLNAIDAFLNANVQGWDRLVETLNDPRTAKSARTKIIGGLVVPSIALTALAMQDPRHAEIPAWEKGAFWHIPIPGSLWRMLPQEARTMFGRRYKDDAPILRIPKPHGYAAVFVNPAEMATEWLAGRDPKALEGFVSALSQNLPNPVPNALQVPLELGANYSFFQGRNIVPEAIGERQPEHRYTEFTTETAKNLGAALGLAPMKIEHGVKGLFGGLGSLALKGADLATPEGREKLAKVPFGVESVPFVSAFVSGHERGDNQIIQDFYKRYKKAKEAAGSERFLRKTDREEAREFTAENRPELRRYRRLAAINEQIADIRAKRRALAHKTRLTREERADKDLKYERLMIKHAMRGLAAK